MTIRFSCLNWEKISQVPALRELGHGFSIIDLVKLTLTRGKNCIHLSLVNRVAAPESIHLPRKMPSDEKADENIKEPQRERLPSCRSFGVRHNAHAPSRWSAFSFWEARKRPTMNAEMATCCVRATGSLRLDIWRVSF